MGRQSWPPPAPRRRPPRSPGQILGIVVVTVLVLVGLAFVAAIVLFMVGMSRYGSNK